MAFWDKLKNGLKKTRDGLVGKMDTMLAAFGKVDEDLFEELEGVLISADFGLETTEFLMEALRKRVKEGRLTDPADVRNALQEEIATVLNQGE